jgi:hypothetical protein
MKMSLNILTRSLTFVLIFFFYRQVHYSQNGLTNMSFEAWTNSFQSPAPTGWSGFNLIKMSTGAEEGKSYLKMTKTLSGIGQLILCSTASPTSNLVAGAPLTLTPVSLDGFYKSSGLEANDSIVILALTSKSGSVQTVAQLVVTKNVDSWFSFTIPFLLVDIKQADTINIYVTNGGDNATTAMFDLDNISLVTKDNPRGLDMHSLGTAFMVFPNPASHEINFLSKDETAASILVTVIDGKTVGEIFIEGEQTKVDLKDYNCGLYFYSILDKYRKVLLSGRFSVIK